MVECLAFLYHRLHHDFAWLGNNSSFFPFYGRWKPVLRCITATYDDKARTERNRNHLKGTGYNITPCIINRILIFDF